MKKTRRDMLDGMVVKKAIDCKDAWFLGYREWNSRGNWL